MHLYHADHSSPHTRPQSWRAIVPRRINSIQISSSDCVRLRGGSHAKIKKYQGHSHKLALLLDAGGKSKG